MKSCLNEGASERGLEAMARAFSDNLWKNPYKGSRVDFWIRGFDIGIGGAYCRVEVVLERDVARPRDFDPLSDYGPLESRGAYDIVFFFYPSPAMGGPVREKRWTEFGQGARDTFDKLLRGEPSEWMKRRRG